VRTRWPDGADAVILCAGNPDLVDGCVAATRNGGRVVLFAGFGDRPVAPVDLNALHYREVALIGSEWIGAPPNQQRDCYALALDLIVEARVDVARLITDRCSFDGVEDALIGRGASTVLKTIFTPHLPGGDS
jgi:threonine dehydrogenase-like Zn-dependent dehydrogenase